MVLAPEMTVEEESLYVRPPKAEATEETLLAVLTSERMSDSDAGIPESL